MNGLSTIDSEVVPVWFNPPPYVYVPWVVDAV
jgi:hypothetical protein